MTEEEMKTKECPQHLTMVALFQMLAVQKEAEDEVIDKISELGCCTGSACAMWEPEYEEEEKEIAWHKDIPEGWCARGRPHNQMQKIIKYTQVASGDCGLKTKENGGFYPG